MKTEREVLLSSSKVIKEIKISLRQLYYWEMKGIVNPKLEKLGSREFKRYTREDTETLKTVKNLLDEGYALPTTETLKEIIKRKNLEKALRESKERYRDLIDNVNDIILSFDSKGNIIYFNKMLPELTGYSEEELKSMNVLRDLVATDLREEAKGHLRRLIEGGIIKNASICFIKKNGERLYLECNSTGVYDEEGNFLRTRCVLRDITERKKAEEALRIKDNAIASSINAFAIADLKGNLTYVNNSFLKMWGYNDDKEILGKPAVKFWQREDKAWEVIEALRDSRGWLGEIVAMRKDGSTFDVHLSASMVKDEGGGPICMMSSFIDITERKQAEALRQRAEELKTMNDMAIELATMSSSADIYKLICERLKGITGALFISVTSYDSQKQELKVEHICADSKFITKTSKILGRKVQELRFSLEPYQPEWMVSQRAVMLAGLDELMFGTIPRAIAHTLKKTLGIGDIYALALHHGGKLMGTMAVLMPRHQPLLSLEMLEVFAHLAAASLQRMQAVEELHKAQHESEI